MKLGIMQPYFFPYIGYFQLIHYVDRWLFFDPTQFTKKSWITRNRILKPGKDWQYIKIPVDNYSSRYKIKEVNVSYEKDWSGLILRQLEHYKKHAKNYDKVIEFLEQTFSENSATSITETNAFFIKKVFNYLEIPFNYEIYSHKDINLGEINHPGDWALEISKVLGAGTYVNPPGGKSIFIPEKFENNGIQLEFLHPVLEPYDQRRKEFINGLSIIDLLMFLDAQEIRSKLDEFKIEKIGN